MDLDPKSKVKNRIRVQMDTISFISAFPNTVCISDVSTTTIRQKNVPQKWPTEVVKKCALRDDG